MTILFADLQWLTDLALLGNRTDITGQALVGLGQKQVISLAKVPASFWVGGRLYLEVTLSNEFYENPVTALTIEAPVKIFIDKLPNRVAETGMTIQR